MRSWTCSVHATCLVQDQGHVCNSAGTVNFRDALPTARPGLILGRAWPSPYCKKSVEPGPVFEVKTSVALVRAASLQRGRLRSQAYDPWTERVAILPIGYHDGYTRPFP